MNYSEKHIALIANPVEGNSKALRMTEQISTILKSQDIKHSLFTYRWPETWQDITEAWIIGGDGTLNWFINRYPDLRLPLSVFPGGSGNDLRWMLYGDVSVENQIDCLLKGKPILIDGGICNGKLFINGLGIGFDGAIVKDLIGKRKIAGKASYLVSIMKNILTYHEKLCTIIIKDEIIEENCFMISVANAKRYGGGFNVAPHASVSDGFLDLCVIGKISPFKRIHYLPVVEKGEHINLPFVRYRKIQSAKISCSQKMHAHLDGEYFFTDVFDIKILPDKFSFLK